MRGPHARFCEKDKGPVSYWALALLDASLVEPRLFRAYSPP